MEDWAVSPRYRSSELVSGRVNAIDVFEDQVKGWVLEFAKRLTAEEHSGIAVMMVCTSYFEWVESFRRGKDSRSKSEEFFKSTFQRLFPDLASSARGVDAADILYHDLRCGLYHEGLMRGRIVFRREGEAIEIRDAPLQVVINANAFLDNIITDFDQYLHQLRAQNAQPDELKSNFERMWLERAQDPSETCGAAEVVPAPGEIVLETRAPVRSIIVKM